MKRYRSCLTALQSVSSGHVEPHNLRAQCQVVQRHTKAKPEEQSPRIYNAHAAPYHHPWDRTQRPLPACQGSAAMHTEVILHIAKQSDDSQVIVNSEADSHQPDLSLLRPELQREWMHSKNTLFGSQLVKPGSNSKAWWRCDKCPEGIPHIWATEVRRRSAGSGCPYCASKRVCKCNSLATRAQATAMSWDYIQNGASPEQFCQFSNKSVHWKCWLCGHEWTAKIRSRTLTQSGCPNCFRTSGQAKLGKRLPSLAESQPSFLAEWHPTFNEQHGLYPEDLTLGSNQIVWWLCTKCPHHQEHVWQASPQSRQSSDCPYCAHRAVCVCNSLQTHFPALAAEMDNADNELSSAQVTAKSNVSVWWKSAEHGAWMQQVNRRTAGAVKGSVLYDADPA